MLDHLKHLSEIRKASGLTQLQLANRLGVSQPNIARLEKLPGTASLQQLEDWLRATSLLMPPHGSLIKVMEVAPYSVDTQFALGLEEVLRGLGINVEIYRKPLVAICADGASGWAIAVPLVRSLLASGDKYFAGFYLPSRCCTVLWRHVSTRPRNIAASVVVLDDVLEPWMRSAPTHHMPLARDEDGYEKLGSFIVAEDAIIGQTVIAYSDHPLLLHCDLLQVPPLGEDTNSYFNLAMIANAEIRILCAGQGMRLSATSLLMSIAAGRAFDFVALEEGQADDRVRETFHSIFGGRPVRISLGLSDGIRTGNADAMKIFSNMVIDMSDAAQKEVSLALNDPGYITRVLNYSNSQGQPPISGLADARIESIIRVAGARELTYPIEDIVLKRLWMLATVVSNPRLDPSSDSVDPVSYATQLTRAVEGIGNDPLIEASLPPIEYRKPVPQSIRNLVCEFWKTARSEREKSKPRSAV